MRTITKEQINTLLKYLMTRPYNEVFQLIQLIASLPEVMSKDDGQKDTKQK